jgi:hypothetical protein
MHSHMGIAFGNRVNNQDLWEAGLVVKRGEVAFVPMGLYDTCLNNSKGCQESEGYYPGMSRTVPGSSRKVAWLLGPCLWERGWQENL